MFSAIDFCSYCFIMISKIADLLEPEVWAGNALIPTEGWVIFGGLGNDLTKSQKFSENQWQLGPDLVNKQPTGVQCVTQVISK